MSLAFYYLFAAIGFAAFALVDPSYAGLSRTMIVIYLALVVFWGTIDTIQNWPRRGNRLSRS